MTYVNAIPLLAPVNDVTGRWVQEAQRILLSLRDRPLFPKVSPQ